MEAMMQDGWYDEATATLGDRIAAARERAGLAPEDLAARMGVRTRTILHWENDMAEPRSNRLQILAGVLGVSLMWMMTGRGDGVASPEAGEAGGGAEGQAAARRAGPDEAAQLSEEVRAIRAELGAVAERMVRLEGRLRTALATAA